MLRAVALTLVLVAPIVLAAAPTDDPPWWRTTLLDVDHDGVDDALAPLLQGSDPLVVLVDYASMPTAGERAALSRVCEIASSYQNFPILAARCERPSDVRGLLQQPGVVLVEKDDVLVPLLRESVPLIGANQVWTKYRATGKGIAIAILDDGAFEQHPDFQGKVEADYDAGAPQTPLAAPAPIGLVSPAGEEGHGTHVAGIALGPGLESGGEYRGVAPDALLVNVKVFSGPNQTTSDIVLRGLDWTVSHLGDLKIRVATMSLGGRASDGQDALSRAVDLAVDKGLVVVAAAGNTGPDKQTITSPGAAVKAITVGAVDKQKRIADFSSRGPTLDGRTKPDLVAPGVDITSTIPPASTSTINNLLSGKTTTYYGTLSGTSMATPHVAGVVALMLEVAPSLAPKDVKKMLLVTAQDLGPAGVDNDTGFGFVNAIAAVQVAKDPSLLDQPQFQSRLSQVPNPPPESPIEKLSYEMSKLERSPYLLYYVGGAFVGVVAIAAVAVAIARRPPKV